jgi:3-hydroxyacyl-CoA dehydrogenase
MPSVTFRILTPGVAMVAVDNPPVNALSADVRQGLDQALLALADDPEVGAVVIACEGRTFFAGADITEFGKPVEDPALPMLLATIEAFPKPIVAALHGTALGGGFELALSCHYRIAASTARVGLPEVLLGILPGAGGTQRLPRLVGAQRALDIITSGRQVAMDEAMEAGLVDRVVPDDELRQAALDMARSAMGHPLPRVRDRLEWIERDRQDPALFEAFTKANARRFRGFKAPGAIVRAIEAAVTLPFDEGLALESRLCDVLISSPESLAQRHIFFAERETARIPDVPRDMPAIAIDTVAVIGAGTMGTGITLALLAGGLAVTLVETNAQARERGLAHVRDTIATQVKRGRIDPDRAHKQLEALSDASDLDAIASADLVIEAVYEDMALKRQIFATLDRLAKPGALLASNTSFLDIDEIAAATSRPEDVLGLHFFSPANVMRLLEIVRGARTSPQAIRSAFELARRIGKVGVLSRICDGFIANRLMLPRAHEAERLALAGVAIADIDRVLVEYGFAIGHFQMMDMAGLDVVTRAEAERSLMGELVARGRLGLKSGAGFYEYDDKGRPMPSSEVTAVIEAWARDRGVVPAAELDDAALLDRLLAPVVREGQRILSEGIALRASDIDVAAVLGFNWPVYRGGPLHWHSAGAV